MRKPTLLLLTVLALAACSSKSEKKVRDDDDRGSAPKSAQVADSDAMRAHLAEVAARPSAVAAEPTDSADQAPPPVLRYGIRGPGPDPHVARMNALADAKAFGMEGLMGSTSAAASALAAPTATGRLPPEVIQRIVRSHFSEIRLCYLTALDAAPGLEGKIVVAFIIGHGGSVSSVTTSGEPADPAFTSCVSGAFRAMSFPAPEGGVVSVTYPMTFTPGETTLNQKALGDARASDVEEALKAARCTDIVLTSSNPSTWTATRDGHAFTITFVSSVDSPLTEAAIASLRSEGVVYSRASMAPFLLAIADEHRDKAAAKELLEVVLKTQG
ncbi:MAG: AgmX/PglI C-terminal domain-containing protein [Polyangiaceae bacterium]